LLPKCWQEFSGHVGFMKRACANSGASLGEVKLLRIKDV